MHPTLTNIDDVMPEKTFCKYHQWSSKWTITRVAYDLWDKHVENNVAYDEVSLALEK
ncbi:hypothetical protein Tco_1564589, partial [Tanacetum coccineum]